VPRTFGEGLLADVARSSYHLAHVLAQAVQAEKAEGYFDRHPPGGGI
jgi:hypothetical protein